MSKNISNLSGRIGLKDNLFKKISENTLSHNSQNSQEIAKQYNMGVSTIHELLIHPCYICLLYTSPSPRDRTRSRMPSSA